MCPCGGNAVSGPNGTMICGSCGATLSDELDSPLNTELGVYIRKETVEAIEALADSLNIRSNVLVDAALKFYLDVNRERSRG